MKTRSLVLEALEATSYDYALAAAMFGVSGRQLRVICQDLKLTGIVTTLRLQAGLDRRGRPRKEPPPPLVLRRVLEASKGSVATAALALGVSPPTLRAWIAAA